MSGTSHVIASNDPSDHMRFGRSMIGKSGEVHSIAAGIPFRHRVRFDGCELTANDEVVLSGMLLGAHGPVRYWSCRVATIVRIEEFAEVVQFVRNTDR